MKKSQTIWSPAPAVEDYPAAQDYVSSLFRNGPTLDPDHAHDRRRPSSHLRRLVLYDENAPIACRIVNLVASRL